MTPFPLFLTRHGQSEAMLEGLLGGDSPLTAQGQAYALSLARIIQEQLASEEGYDRSRHSHSVPAVLTSTLQRTIQTAAHLPFQQQHLPALNEINAGIAELMTYKQVQQHYPEVAAARSRDKLRFRYPDGESYLDLVQRLWPVVHQLEQRQSPVIVVAHQAVLRVVLGLLMRKPLQDIPTMSIPLHTVMQLMPAAAGGGYDMQLFKADLPPPPTAHQATPTEAAAGVAAADKEARAGATAASKQVIELHASATSSASYMSSGGCRIHIDARAWPAQPVTMT